MFGRRGQGAMEYLMTYGWAILVVMIVGIVMWQLGIFNMGSTSVTATGFSRLKPQLASVNYDGSGGQLTAIFTNGAGTRITVSEILVEQGTAASGTQTGLGSFGAGENFNIDVTGLRTDIGTSEVFDVDVSITYTVDIGGTTSTVTDSGTLRGPAA
jgi:hypothetical protein